MGNGFALIVDLEMRKIKSPSIKKLRNKADKLYQEVGMKGNPICEICGVRAQVIHHYIAKSVSSALRYYRSNGIPLCNGCHMRLHFSGDPEYENKIKEKRGQEWLNDLRDKRKKPVKISAGYYQRIIENL